MPPTIPESIVKDILPDRELAATNPKADAMSTTPLITRIQWKNMY